MITALIVYLLAHVGALTAPPAIVNAVAGGAAIESGASFLNGLHAANSRMRIYINEGGN